MDVTKQAWLVDNFMQSQKLISLVDSNAINFNVTNDPVSSSPDRFMLVFKPPTVLAVSATTLRRTGLACCSALQTLPGSDEAAPARRPVPA